MTFSASVLTIDAPAVALEIEAAIRAQVLGTLRRKGVVVGVSGGVDSSVVVTLATRALGKEKVLALLMPERDSSPASLELGMMLAKHLGIESIVEDIRPTLEGAGCYERQNQAIRTVFPDYAKTPGYKCKLALPSLLEGDRLNVTKLTVQDPSGAQQTSRMSPAAYLQLVAATNFKQRIRKLFECLLSPLQFARTKQRACQQQAHSGSTGGVFERIKACPRRTQLDASLCELSLCEQDSPQRGPRSYRPDVASAPSRNARTDAT